MKTRIVTVVGTKGRVGASTIALELGTLIARNQHHGSALLVDLRPGPLHDHALAPWFSRRPVRGLDELRRALDQHRSVVLDGWFPSLASGLSVALRGAERSRDDDVSALLDVVAPWFGTVLIDLPTLEDPAASGVLERSDVAILVSDTGEEAVVRTGHALDEVRIAGLQGQRLVLALNRVPENLSGARLESAFRRKPATNLPEDGKALSRAHGACRTLVEASPQHPFTAGILDLARLVARTLPRPAKAGSHRDVSHVFRDGARTPHGAAAGGSASHAAVDPAWHAAKKAVQERLLSDVDASRFTADRTGDGASRLGLRQEVERKLRQLVEAGSFSLRTPAEVDRFVGELLDDVLGLGPLETLLRDDTVTEIMVNGAHTIFVERKGIVEATDLRFQSEEHLRAVVERILAPIGRRIDEKNPMVDARLADGSRVNVILPPLSLRGACLTIRKFARDVLSTDALVNLGSLSEEMGTFLRACVIGGRNLLVSGGTSSGKTTLLNCLSEHIPAAERVITIEDAAELRLQQRHVISLEARPPSIEGTGAIPIRKLLENALRMRPDRIVIGECRGAEALDMLQAMNTGHDGCLTTVHANGPRDSLTRLETLASFATDALTERGLRAHIAAALDLVVHVARLEDGTRKIVEVSELAGLADDDYVVRPLFRFERSGVGRDGKVLGRYVATGTIPTFLQDLEKRGLSVSSELFESSTAA